jgi:hypothetical protein
MLRSLTVGNVKSIGRTQKIPLAPITLIFGPNSGGKSTLIQSLLLLRQSIIGESNIDPLPLQLKGPLVDLGNFRAAVHKHQISRKIVLGLEAEVRLPPANVLKGLRKRGKVVHIMTSPSEWRAVGASAAGIRVATAAMRGSTAGAVIGLGTEFHFGSTAKGSAVQLTGVKYTVGSEAPLTIEFKKTARGRRVKDDFDEDAADAVLKLQLEAQRTHPQFHRVFSKRKPIGADLSIEHLRALSARQGIKFEESDFQLLMQEGQERTTKARSPMLSLRMPNLSSPMISGASMGSPASRKSRADLNLEAELMQALLGSIALASRWNLLYLSYLGPLRSHPERYYLAASGSSNTVGIRGENLVPVLIKDAASTNRGLEAATNSWLERFGVRYRLSVRVLSDPVAGDFHVLELMDLDRKIPVAPSDIGFGFSQLLPIIVGGLLSATGVMGATICVEQPEIHLHPRLQAEVADFLIETSSLEGVEGSDRIQQGAVQWIVETHSEALMLRIQRRIRERKFARENISVLYVQPTVSGESNVIQLRLDEEGDFIDEWPGGFFEEAYREKFSTSPK